MNHDVTHCLDYKKGVCPKKCYRAEVTEELIYHRIDLVGIPMSWAHYKGTKECEMKENGKE